MPVVTLPFAASLFPGLFFRTRASTPADLSNLGRDALVEAGVLRNEARVTVIRESADDIGFREIFLSIDGESVAMLSHGQRFTTELPSGPHRLRAHNTLFWRTLDVVLKPGEHAEFTAVNRAGWGTFGMLFVIGAMPVYLTFERRPHLVPSRPRDATK